MSKRDIQFTDKEMQIIKESFYNLDTLDIGCFYNSLRQLSQITLPKLGKMVTSEERDNIFLIEDNLLDNWEFLMETDVYKYFKKIGVISRLNNIFDLANKWYGEFSDEKLLNLEKNIQYLAKTILIPIHEFCAILKNTAQELGKDEYFSSMD